MKPPATAEHPGARRGAHREAGAAPRPDFPVVNARGLCKRYDGRAVVDAVDLDVQRGECFGLLGPNGAGKTTTLRMLLGLTPPDGGSLTVLGCPVPRQARAMRRRVGVVPQVDNLDPDFSVRENLLTYASYFGLRGPQVRRRVAQLLEFASLEGRPDTPIGALSGGMKRRLTLARALISDPELIVLDEPTTGLDPQARQHIWQRLRLLQSRGATLILTTHYMEEAERLCDRLAIFDAGRIVALGSPESLIRQHIEPQVLELRGDDARGFAEAASRLPVRREWVGETLFLYFRDERPVLDALYRHAGLRYLNRPANLEDVFLRLTGRDLRD
ncbi:MAG TPA: ATP-binding cassette domain-containing protein [Gammaproteobacteria bacterium]|nr:ATP-binding cassette domain-containing protein [Gammaproteobacteria bacterium]